MKNPISVDLVSQFYKENVDLSKIEQSRASRTVVNLGLEPYTGTWGVAQKKHLLNRVLTGYSNRHLMDISSLNLSDSLDLIFKKDKIPSVPINDYDYEISKEETEKQGHYYIEPGKEYIFAPEPNGSPWPRHQSHDAWLFKNMIEQNTSIHWRMVFFLHNLLACGKGSVKMMYQHYKMLFDSSFESYKSIIYKVTIDPMMLDYLNLQQSQKFNPDENYAREIQELFTVGKGVNSKFTEEDVSEMARLLVGWQYFVPSKNEKFGPITNIFNAWNHDTGDKHFSAFYGNRVIKGRQGSDGMKELDDAIDMIFDTEECALYLSRRLYQFFCYPLINDTIEKNIISPMADLLRKNNFELMVPLKALLGSAHFFDNSFYNAMIKSPLEFGFGIIKEFEFNYINYELKSDIPLRYTSSPTKDFYKYRSLQWDLSNIGLNFTDPPSVSGWSAYYQAPVYDLFWINSDTVAKRANWGNGLGRWGKWIGNGDTKGGVHMQIDFSKFLTTLKNPSNIDDVISETIDRLMSVPISSAARLRIRSKVLEGVSSTYYTQMYQNHLISPTDETRSTISNRMTNLLGSLFQMGEIHLF
ncbi:DUF1800 family protein [Aquirufa rosea]|uniref:DUF1800 family protein n=1 Tax=Aquirufa rosea TaxID=2509241 RepID=A0A4Q1BXU9_9BACT|nr:DUF1800 family protein [Aquirufa rosea]RXK47195.1 DUF1800 family protein [Aquirufa rosea]